MSELPPASFNYCGKCGAATYLDAKYCQNCGEVISPNHASRPSIDRVAEFFPTYYVTFISIIQATVLGYLLLVARDQLSSILTGTYDPLWTLLTVGMFIMIAATWMNYTHYVTFLKLRPTSLDALIPFCFGATQALVIFCISLQQLAWFFFANVANATVAMSQTYVSVREARLHQEYEENRAFVEKFGTFSRSNLTRWFAARFSIFLLFGIAEALLNLHSLLLAIAYLALCVISFVVVGRGAKRMALSS